MAERTSSKMLKARQRAQDLAKADLEREQALIQKAAEFFTAFESVELADEQLAGEIEKIRSDAEKKIQAAREKSAQRSENSRLKAASVASEMIDMGLAQKKVADRLGLSITALRKLLNDAMPGSRVDESETRPEPGTDPVLDAGSEQA